MTTKYVFTRKAERKGLGKMGAPVPPNVDLKDYLAHAFVEPAPAVAPAAPVAAPTAPVVAGKDGGKDEPKEATKETPPPLEDASMSGRGRKP